MQLADDWLPETHIDLRRFRFEDTASCGQYYRSGAMGSWRIEINGRENVVNLRLSWPSRHSDKRQLWVTGPENDCYLASSRRTIACCR